MNSIDENQPEDNCENLTGKDAIKKMRELSDKASSCFFCTNLKHRSQSGALFTTRPMAPQNIDEDGNFWFLSAKDSHKNHEIGEDAAVQLLFQGSKHSDFLRIQGRASISTNKRKIEELWQPQFKTWFTEGKDDPRISLIKVTPLEGYYWDTKHGAAVMMVKMVIGAITGKTLDDSVQGSVRP